MYAINISKEALDSLFEIEYYLRWHESDRRTDKIMASIENQIELIAVNPFQYPIYKGNNAIRKAVVHNTYIVLFEIFETDIKIIEVYHGKRNV